MYDLHDLNNFRSDRWERLRVNNSTMGGAATQKPGAVRLTVSVGSGMGVSMGLGMGMGMGMAHSSGGRQLSFSLFDNRHAADHWRTPLLCVLSDAQFYFASSKCDRERERESRESH